MKCISFDSICTASIPFSSERCRSTLRGHADSVNSITFLPYSNNLLTCSADKTLSLWDARTVLYRNICSHATFSNAIVTKIKRPGCLSVALKIGMKILLLFYFSEFVRSDFLWPYAFC